MILANALWYTTKVLLRKRGYQVHWFYGHLADFPNMVRLIRATPQSTERTLYVVLLSSLVVVVVAFIAAAAHLLLTFGAA